VQARIGEKTVWIEGGISREDVVVPKIVYKDEIYAFMAKDFYWAVRVCAQLESLRSIRLELLQS